MTEINLQDWVGRSSTEEDIASGVSAARLATLLEQEPQQASTEPRRCSQWDTGCTSPKTTFR